MNFTVRKVTVGQMSTNCYIIKKDGCRDAVIIDPGADTTVIQDALHRMEASCRLILLTHGHFDHILSVGDLRGADKPVAIHKDDAEMLTHRDMFSSLIPYDPRPFAEADILLDSDGFVSIAGFDFEVLHTPGHTKGSVCYIFGDSIFTGDTLFRGSVGTVDFGGDRRQLNESLRRLKGIPREYGIFPGHGQSSTLSDEREHNPFMLSL